MLLLWSFSDKIRGNIFPMATSRIIDNHRQSLLAAFQELASKHEEISIATGYWDLPGTTLVLPQLKDCKKIRLLIGREPLIPRYQLTKPEVDFPDKDFFSDLERLEHNETFRESVVKIKDLIAKGVLEVRVYKEEFFHAKCYIFGNYESPEAVGIIGSSNFTKNGLTANTELNALEADHRIVTYTPRVEDQEVGHLAWFDQFWNKSLPWDQSFTAIISQSSHGDLLFTPYEMYIKTLYEIYKEELEDEDLKETTRGTFTLHDFQMKNVHGLMRRLRKHKVAMLADSVGLGKTITAIEVIKQYKESGLRVEIICPKSLTVQWEKQMATQRMDGSTPITLQNPREIERRRGLDSIAAVGLFVIDESHNLKSRSGKRFKQITEWIGANPKAHVLLLTATPINNQLSDITNQILLACRGEAGLLRFAVPDKKNKQTTIVDFNQAVENLARSIKRDAEEGKSIDFGYVRATMSPILREFVVRRTRQGIEKEYGGLVDDQGILQTFPKVVPDVRAYRFNEDVAKRIRDITTDSVDLDSLYSLTISDIVDATQRLTHPIDQISNAQSSGETADVTSPIALIYRTILLLGFLPYRWQMYRTKFYGKTREEIKEMKLSSDERNSLFSQLSIYGILRTMFLKRLESSVSAIHSSLETYDHKLDIFERGLRQGKIITLTNIDEIDEILGDVEDKDAEEVEVPEEFIHDTIDENNYVVDALKADVAKERELIDLLRQQLVVLHEDDSKLKTFVGLIEDLAKRQPAGKKVLIFSYYADTINYLREVVETRTNVVNKDNAAFLSSNNREDAESLAGRFSPVSKQHALKDGEKELSYLFSTDILSEGQNLQDCGILVNYDLHWNPVRMIQRNGRVNRLGTSFKDVYIYNISPEGQLDEYLRLVARLERKIDLIRNTIGTDTPVLDEKANPIEFVDSWKDVYSSDVEARMEAIQNAEGEADFLLAEDEFVSDLKRFHHDPNHTPEQKAEIYNIPKRKWGVMPTATSRGDERPDVLSLVSLQSSSEVTLGYAFVAMNRDGREMHHVPQLQALEWLRSTIQRSNERQADHISADRVNLLARAKEAAEAYHDDEVVIAPVGQQGDVLRIMYELHFSQDDLDVVRMAFGTKNVLAREDMKKCVRRIVKTKNENGSVLQDVQTILDIARSLQRNIDRIERPNGAEPLLMYARTNE
ncbi:MAG: helicase-related protein [Patescibacteria group bacterium]